MGESEHDKLCVRIFVVCVSVFVFVLLCTKGFKELQFLSKFYSIILNTVLINIEIKQQ